MSKEPPMNAPASPNSIGRLQNSIREAIRNKDTEEVFEFLGENNGWTIEELIQAPQEVTQLDLFLVNMKKLPELKYFPFVTVLKLQHIGLTTMADLKPLACVEELWLPQNDITKIEGLENMTKLRKLYLNGNRITSMEGLPVLKHLRELWLSQNEITSITHLENVRKLRSLCLASNPIRSLEDAFGPHLSSLHSLNLSACRLYSFHHVAFLASLPCLRSLWFSDPLFGENAICRLNNYTTYTLHVLTALEVLDYNVITPEQRALADSIYGMKRVYYSMRIHTLDRNFGMLVQKAEQMAEEKAHKARGIKRLLVHHLNGIQNDLTERSTYNRSSVFEPDAIFPTAKLEETKNLLSRAVGTREVELRNISKKLSEAVSAAHDMKQHLKEQLCVELNTGGNIRLDEVAPKDSWSESAHELVFARFKPENYKKYGIEGIEINRVYRVLNRGLRLRFDERVKEMDIDLANPYNRKSLLCLFSIVPSTRQGEDALLQHMLIHGMDTPVNLKKDSVLHPYLAPQSEGVPLTNSVFLADEERLNTCLKSGQLNGINANPNALSSRLFVFRVFLGKSVIAIGGSNKDDTSTFVRGGKKVVRKDYGSDVFSVYRTLPDDSHIRAWYCFDRTLVLPELLIDFTYKPLVHMTVSPSLPLVNMPEVLKKYIDSVIPPSSRSDGNDVKNVCYPLVGFMKWCEPGAFDQFAKEESDKALQKGNSLLAMVSGGGATEPSGGNPVHNASPFSKDVILHYAAVLGQTDPKKLSFCCLRLKGFTVIRQDIASVVHPNITVLDLSRNKISLCSWFGVATAFPNLKHFNLSDNELLRLDLQSCVMANMQTLDVSYNKLEDLSEIEAIPVSFPKLQRLTINNNPMMTKKNTEAIVLSYFFETDLAQLNDLDLLSSSTLPLPCVRRKRTLDLQKGQNKDPPMALKYLLRMAHKEWKQQGGACDLLSLDSDVTPERFFEDSVRLIEDLDSRKRTSTMVVAIHEAESISDDGGYDNFFPSVPTFQYYKSLMKSIDFIEWLPNLRHLILRGHNISDIRPALQLKQLHILDVQDNCLVAVPDLTDLQHLVEVNVSFNQIKSLAPMGVLPQLRCLSASGNLIDSLDISQMSKLEKLKELYLAKNRFNNKTDFYGLKDLPQLITLDLVGNPMMSADKGPNELEEIRCYFIYHFRRLKMLDSQPVSLSESQRAREVFAGKMSACLLSERTGLQKKLWDTVKELDLSHCCLREVSMLEPFVSVEVLRLDHNTLTKLDGITCLRNLKALNLSHNKLGSAAAGSVGAAFRHTQYLESLSLEANHLTDIASLKLELPRLKFLNLKNNEIQFLEKGLCKLPELREIILEQNKLRCFGSDCFVGCRFLTEIAADENALRSTEGLATLQYLEVLSMGVNRLGDQNLLLSDIKGCPLTKLTLVGNPVTRKSRYRQSVIQALPTLAFLDGKAITNEEREKAENSRPVELVTPPNVVIDMNFLGTNGGNSGERQNGNGSASGERLSHSLPSAQSRLHLMNPAMGQGKPPILPGRRAANMISVRAFVQENIFNMYRCGATSRYCCSVLLDITVVENPCIMLVSRQKSSREKIL
eukprot:gene7380-5194_t